MFIDIVMLLWALNIEKAVDIHGEEIIPDRNDINEAGAVV